MIRTLTHLRRFAPKTAWKYLAGVAKKWILTTAIFFGIGVVIFQIEISDYRKIVGLLFVVGVFSYSFAVGEVDIKMKEDRLQMLEKLFVEGINNLNFVYCTVEAIDDIFLRIRKVVTENTDVDFYNDTSFWDFDELLTKCVNDLRDEVDSDIRAEMN